MIDVSLNSAMVSSPAHRPLRRVRTSLAPLVSPPFERAGTCSLPSVRFGPESVASGLGGGHGQPYRSPKKSKLAQR